MLERRIRALERDLTERELSLTRLFGDYRQIVPCPTCRIWWSRATHSSCPSCTRKQD